MRLFVYGTLTDEARVAAITGRRLPRRPGRLDGYRRVVASHGYADLEVCVGARVDGFVLDDVDAAALRALDAYEDAGRLYHRRSIRVAVGDGVVECEAYIGSRPE